MSASGDTSAAAADLGTGLTGLAQVGAGALLLLIGFLLASGLSKGLTRTASRIIPAARVLRAVR